MTLPTPVPIQWHYQTTTQGQLIEYLDSLWETDKLVTLKFIAYLRQIHGGLGQRRLGRWALFWLGQKSPENLLANLDGYVSKYGRYDDLVCLVRIPNLTRPVIGYIADKLVYDLECLIEGKRVSICAKWIPSEGSSLDRLHFFNKLLAEYLNLTHRELRIGLTKLRAAIREQSNTTITKKEIENDYSDIILV